MSDLLRETFAAYAEGAPRADGLASAARRRAAARRARVVVAASAAAVVAVAIGAVALVPSRRDARPVTPVPPVTPSPFETPPGTFLVSFAGYHLALPDHFVPNGTRCHTPIVDTWLVLPRVDDDCLEPHRPGVTAVRLGSYDELHSRVEGLRGAATETVELDGLTAFLTTGTDGFGDKVASLLLASSGSIVEVTGPDLAAARAIALTARPILRGPDHVGCDAGWSSFQASTGEVLVRDGWFAAAVCRYGPGKARWLLESAPLTEADAREMAATFNALPRVPFVEDRCDEELLVVVFQRADSQPDRVRIIDGCRRVAQGGDDRQVPLDLVFRLRDVLSSFRG